MSHESAGEEPVPKYPFRILHVFFPEIMLKRADVLPEGTFNIPLQIEVAFGFTQTAIPQRYALRIRASSGDEKSDISIVIVGVAVFESVGEKDPSDQEIADFVRERALLATTSRFLQILGTSTGQMGMPPIWPNTPMEFGFDVGIVSAARAAPTVEKEPAPVERQGT